MRTVRDVMRRDIEVLRTTETAADAASYLASHEDEPIPLCLNDGSLAGSVSNRDIVVKVVAKGLDAREVTLAEFAEPADVLAIDIDVPLDEAVAIMCRHRRGRLPVVEFERVVGLVTQRDAARALTFQPFWGDTSWSEGLRV